MTSDSLIDSASAEQSTVPEEPAKRTSRTATPSTLPGHSAAPPTVPEKPAQRASRRATLIDLAPDRFAECLDVLHEGFGTEVAEFGLTPENTPTNPAFWHREEIVRLTGRGFQLFAIEEDAALVGCAFVGSSARSAVWTLRHLAVRARARHRGYGEALVREAARRASLGGADTLRIGIVAENRRLAAWYQRLGFVTVEAGVQYPGLVFTVDHLELIL